MNTKDKSKVKGTKITSKLKFLREEYGDAMVEMVVASLEPGDQVLLGAIVDLGWYDLSLYETLVGAIVEVAGKGHEHILERIGRHSAGELSQHAYKVYYRSGDPETVLQKMVPVHTSLNDPGKMEVAKHRNRKLSVVVSEPRGSLLHCKVARAFYQRSVELCGVSNVVVTEARCSGKGDAVCEFVISWG